MKWTGEVFKNTASKTLEEIKMNARIINIMTFDDGTLKDPQEIVFVVSKSRGFEDYKAVSRHEERSKLPKLRLNPYSENLFEACFKGW